MSVEADLRQAGVGGAAALYLDLMKKCLTNTIYRYPDLEPVTPVAPLKRGIASLLAKRGIMMVRERPGAFESREKGLDNNARAHTMIGLERLGNIQYCVERALQDAIPGDLIEAGVWRGGATAFMRAILKAHGVRDRIVWVADSFEGLPPPNEGKYPEDKGDDHHRHRWLAVSLEEVKETFRTYDLLDSQVRFLKGWFRESLPGAGIEKLAVIRLDGDMYESTMDSLANLYPKLSVGGYIILDDWDLIPSCRKAIDDFRSSQGIAEEIQRVDGGAGYWRRER